MKNILNIERMPGYGEYLIDGYQVNYLYGLNDLCKDFLSENHIVLELGSNDGISTELFSKFVKKVVAVDIKITEKFKSLLKDNKNIEFHNLDFDSFYKTNKLKYDLIYIDGSHEYQHVKEDINNSKKILTENGVICGHDYNSTCPGVIKAVNEIFGQNNIKVYSDSSWVFLNKK
jgi:SAM-dependent methyltransferase